MKTSKAYRELKPYIVGLIGDTLAKKGLTSVSGGSGGTELVAHGLNSAFHTGTLGDSQAPQFLKTDGSRTLTGNLSVDASVTIDGVDISAHAADSAAHHDPVSAGDGIDVTGQQVAVDVTDIIDTSFGLTEDSNNIQVKLGSPSGLGFVTPTGELVILDALAGSGLSIASKVLSIDLASPSGLSLSGDELAVADGLAGSGLSMASKVLSIDLASPSGLSLSGDELSVDDSLAGSGLSIASKVLSVNTGVGLELVTDTVQVALSTNSGLEFSVSDKLKLGTMGTVAVGSANEAVLSTHWHAIDHSNDPGANAKILSSTASGGLTLQALSVEGNVDIISGGDLTVGANILFVDASLASIGVNRAPDPQFSVDVAGALRATYLVGPHAIQLEEATGIWHFDGPGPINTNFYGTPNTHMGHVPNQEQNLHYLPGKFQKALALSDGAVTNLMQNPSFETNTTGWTTTSGTPTRTLNKPFTGSYSMRLEDGDEMHSFSSWLSVDVGETLYVSAAFYPENGASGRLRLYNTTSGLFVDTGDTVGSDEWEIVGARWTNDTAGTRTIRVYVDNDTGSAGLDIFVDSICATIDKPSAYVDGSMPNASWSGTAHASTSSLDGAQRLRFDGTGFVDYREGTIMCWFMPTCEIDHDALNDFIVHYESGATEDTIRISQNHNGVYGFEFGGTSITGGTVTPGKWVHLAITWRRANSYFECYIDGVSVGSNSSTSLDSPSGNTYFTVGRDGQNDTNYVGGYIDEVAVTGRFLEDDDILTIYESEAPVFAESSVFTFRATPTQLVWADEEGLWMRNITGGAVFGAYGGAAATKSWAGLTLGQNDLVIGDSLRNGYLHWDDSAGTLRVEGTIVITGGNGIANLTDAGNLAILDDITLSLVTDSGALAALNSVDMATGEVTNKTLDNVSDTGNWRRTAAAAIDGSGFVLIDQVIDGSTFQRTKAAALNASGFVLLDQVIEGTHGLVNATAISAGNIVLSETVGDLDDIDDTGTFGYVNKTILNSRFIQVGSGTRGSTLSGFHINATSIVGQSSGSTQVEMGTDGAITAGGGVVTMDVNGVSIDRATGSSPANTNAYNFVDGTTSVGGLFSYTPSSVHTMQLINDRNGSFNTTTIDVETNSDSNDARIELNVDRNGTLDASLVMTASSAGIPNPAITLSASGGGITLDTADIVLDGSNSILIFGSYVGIGNGGMSPTEQLHVDGGSDSAIARFETDRASGGGFVIEATATGGKIWQGISTANTHAAGGGKYIIKEFGGSNNFIFTADGLMGIKTTTPETELDINGAIQLRELSATPSSTPTSGVEGQIYIKDDKLIIRWNDAGTTRYKYLDLTGTGVTWTHTTSPP